MEIFSDLPSWMLVLALVGGFFVFGVESKNAREDVYDERLN